MMDSSPHADGPAFSADEPTAKTSAAAAPTFVALSGSTSNCSSTMRSLRERRSGSNGASLGLDLDLGTITNSSRERTMTAAASQFRGWSPTTVGPALPALLDPTRADPRALRVMSYNILAARYTSTDTYVQCPVWALSEPYRLRNIVAEVRGANPDILVLEEASTAAMESSELGRSLEAMGYKYYHVPITTDKRDRDTSDSQGSGTWVSSERPDHEGVAIVYRASRFECAEELPLRFNPLAQRDPQLQPDEKRRVMINSHNVAAICVLRDSVTNGHLIVAGLHGFWDTAKPECQVYQVVRLLEEIERMESLYCDMGDVSVFVAGDFNCETRGASVQYVLKGQSAPNGVTRQFPATTGASHSLGLANAYADYTDQHAADRHVSAVGSGFAGIIDYVFYQPAAFDCIAVGKLAPAAEIPNAAVPSDHYPVCAWFVPTQQSACSPR